MEPNLKQIRGIVFDIDGVITDGTMIPLESGDLLRTMDAKDAFAIRAAIKKGYAVGIISGGETLTLRKRFLHVGIKEENLFLGARGKLPLFKQFCTRNGLDPKEVMYFGDDIPDTQVLRACGVGVAPSDAAVEAREAADIVSEYPGGHLCVRYEVERMMREQGTWFFDQDKYDEIF